MRDCGILLILKPLRWRLYAGMVGECEWSVAAGPLIFNVFWWSM